MGNQRDIKCECFRPSGDAWQSGRAVINECGNCALNLLDGCWFGLMQLAINAKATDPHDDRTPMEDRYPADVTDTHDPRYEG